MVSQKTNGFRFKVGSGQRIMLMLPFNVVMVGRVRGSVNPAQLSATFEKLRIRHPLLAVRVQFENDGSGSFLTDGVPAITIQTEPRERDDHWLLHLRKEFRTTFPLETGPLFRCTLIRSPDISEIVLCGHHAICDGMSLGFLLRDMLQNLGNPTQEPIKPLIPPSIDRSTVLTPPPVNALQSFVMSMINKKWEAKDIKFSESDRIQLHEKFWQYNNSMELLAWSMEPEETKCLVERCREEKVTVNSALWTAFLAAQSEVQTEKASYRNRSAMAVNTRDKLKVSAGESCGFFASSLTVQLNYSFSESFWNNARKVHKKISRKLDRTNPFRMLSADLIHPTLLDSLYFQKYGLLDASISAKLLKKMGWHKVTYGYALTNVGRFDIPTRYGSLELEEVYGPLFYSDVEEKMVGVITVGHKLTFLHGSNKALIGDATHFQESSMRHLKSSLDL